MAKGVPKCILLVTNTLIFLIAAAALGVSGYIFFDTVAKCLTKMSLLSVIGIASLALMIFAMLGCKTALTPPQKKCSKCLYLTILLVLFLAEFVAAGYVFNLGHALQVAQDKGFNVTDTVDKAAEDSLVFLHDQLNDLYDDESCNGGSAEKSPSPAGFPFNFSKVECKTKSVDEAFGVLFKDAGIATQSEFDAYNKCTQDPKFNYQGSNKDFTEAFCGSETHIVSLAHKYARYIVWFPVALAGLTFILLVATICLIAQKNQQRNQVRLQTGQEPLRRVQMAGP